jgi:anion transporter
MSAVQPSAFHEVTKTLTVQAMSLRPAVATVLAIAVGVVLWQARGSLSAEAALSLWVFALAIIAWVVLKFDETAVAVGTALLLVGLKITEAKDLYEALGSDLIWLMLGGFVLAATLQHSGLAERWTSKAVSHARSVNGLLYGLTGVIFATAFVIPSTSGRAALLLPIFLVLAKTLNDERLTRALALLFPTAILLSAGASLLGAGAHLVAVDFMRNMGIDAPGFMSWIALAAPFCLLTSFAATALIAHLFLTPEERQRAIALPQTQQRPLTQEQKVVAFIVALTTLGWCTTSIHGLDAAVVAMIGAMCVTIEKLTGISLKKALKQVEWGLLLFLAATLVLVDALMMSGAAKALATQVIDLMPAAAARMPVIALIAAVLVALVSHIVITSRTGRAIVLIPTVALPLAAYDINPAMLILAVTLASGFCQTLMVSAKPVAVFARTDVPTFSDGDLLKLSLALMPLMAVLLMLFAWFIWPLQGIARVAG